MQFFPHRIPSVEFKDRLVKTERGNYPFFIAIETRVFFVTRFMDPRKIKQLCNEIKQNLVAFIYR